MLIYGFLRDVQTAGEHKRWFDFIVECKYLSSRNIYSNNGLQKLKINDVEKYYEIFARLVDLFSVVESALEDGDIGFEFKEFMEVELDNVYSTLGEMKERKH